MRPSLRDVVNKYAGPPVVPDVRAGSDQTNEPRTLKHDEPTIDRVALRKDLSAVNKSNTVWFGVCVGMLVLLFAVTVGLVIFNIDRPGLVKTALSALGISSAGVVTMMIRLWRTKSYTELLLSLAINMDAEAMRTVIGILAKRL